MRKFVIRREVQPKKEGSKPYFKSPKIQRLITPQRLQRKRDNKRIKRTRAQSQREQKKEYDELVAKRIGERKERLTNRKIIA